jgi:hypothetical protein
MQDLFAEAYVEFSWSSSPLRVTVKHGATTTQATFQTMR